MVGRIAAAATVSLVLIAGCQPGGVARQATPDIALEAVGRVLSYQQSIDTTTRTVDGCSIAEVLGISSTRVDSLLRPKLDAGPAAAVLTTTCDLEGRRAGRAPLYGWALSAVIFADSGSLESVVALLWDGSRTHHRRYQLGLRSGNVEVVAHQDSGLVFVDSPDLIVVDSTEPRNRP